MPLKNLAIKVLIVDDERKACINLRNLLLTYVDKDIDIAGMAHDTTDALTQIERHCPDAVFLDIEMPNENAFHFLERIRPVNFEVIFVTAYDEYAVRAFKLNALDYILKPISIIELRTAYQKLLEKISYKKFIAHKSISYVELANQVNNTVKHHRITLKDINTTEVVNFRDIYLVEAQSSYSRIMFFKDGSIKEMILSSPLSDYEELLPADQFFRIHRSYLINCTYIKKIMNDGSNQVIMTNDIAIPVSRRRVSTLIDFLKTNDYI